MLGLEPRGLLRPGLEPAQLAGGFGELAFHLSATALHLERRPRGSS